MCIHVHIVIIGSTMAADAGREPRDGTQTIQRAVMVLRLMTRRGAGGWRPSEITRASGLTHPTCRRILKCLTDERLVVRDPVTNRYRLGPLNYELGLASGIRLEFRDQLRPALERVAAASGDTVYLHIRSGLETVCIDRVEGSFPIRAVTLEVGGRRPLGFGSAGLALLAAMDDREVSDVLDALDNEIAGSPRVTRESLLKSVAAARASGFGIIRDTTVLGVGAIGVVLPPKADRPTLGVGLAMVTERLSPARVRSLHRLLVDEFATV
jgi:DNA-binding IclR family transcriptional regulator